MGSKTQKGETFIRACVCNWKKSWCNRYKSDYSLILIIGCKRFWLFKVYWDLNKCNLQNLNVWWSELSCIQESYSVSWWILWLNVMLECNYSTKVLMKLLLQSQKTQGFCVANFATLSAERMSRLKLFLLFNTVERTLPSKIWRAHKFENSWDFAIWLGLYQTISVIFPCFSQM